MKNKKSPLKKMFQKALGGSYAVFRHFRTANGGNLTICAIAEEKPQENDKSTSWIVGLSLCSPKDQFSRKIGREIAASRAFMGGGTMFRCDRENLFHNLETFAITGTRTTFREVDGKETRLPSWFSKCKKAYIQQVDNKELELSVAEA